MFFQVNVTPEAKPRKKSMVKPPNESEEISVLSLAPFTANPKIFFEDIPVGKEAKRLLCIKNPTKNPIELIITKAPPPERQVSFNWGEKLIEAASEEIFEINWISMKGGPWRDNITFEDGYKIKRDVPITFKSLPPKVTKKPLKRAIVNIKPALKIHKASVPLRKSPKKTMKAKQLNPIITIDSPLRRQTYDVDDKENFNLALSSTLKDNVYASPASSLFNLEPSNNTYTMNKANKKKLNESCTFEDSLEIKSPMKLEEPSPIKRLQSLAFTPLVNHSLTSRLKDINFTPDNNPLFNPSICSTGEKSQNIFNFENEKSQSSFNLETADKEVSPVNLSTETYVKGNNSFETYVKGNLSGETYVKNTSTCTYIKDDSIGDLGALGSPVVMKKPEVPSAKSIIEADMWATEPQKKPKQLDMIAEESSSFSCENLTPSKSFNIRKRKSHFVNMASPPKRLQREENKDWGRKSITTKKTKMNMTLNLKQFINKSKTNLVESDLVVLHNPDAFLSSNPYFYAETGKGFDPFMSATLYYEPKWMDEQEERFKKWLNALLTPPEELSANSDGPKDISRLWQECNRKEVEKPLSKEEISNKVHVKGHLEVLRRNALAIFRSREMSEVLSKSVKMVENKKFEIRADRDVHLNLSLQSEVMSLFLSYNPLWLRIGLEVVFGFKLKLTSNSDVLGLSKFLLQYYFSEPYLLKKYKSVHASNYTAEINKHMLKKFLMLVYFLDRSKNNKLIPHDPCLFCKNAVIKESRELLIKFSSLLLHAIGDITKSLRLIGYVVSYKQTYIHEFEYAIENLGVDLRDGVRLVRIMEIILLRDDLTKSLRVPAISRIQKVHNMKIAFKALVDAEYEILHEIEPKEIVDGYREKTLSFLWQIIHKFEGPRMKKAVITVQHWWNCLSMVIKRRILKKRFEMRNNAARLIQVWYKRQTYRSRLEFFIPLLRQYLKLMKETRAAIKIQARFRMYVLRKRFVSLRKSVVAIQSFSRKWLVKLQMHVKLAAVLRIQSTARTYLARKRFMTLKATVHYVEHMYFAKKSMQVQRDSFLKLKQSAIVIQRKFRATKLMETEKQRYLEIRGSVITIQRAFKAYKDKHEYQQLRLATIYVQQRFRCLKLMEMEKVKYLEKKNAIVVMQRWIRARNERKNYVSLRNAVVLVQRRFRAAQLMKSEREQYVKKRDAIVAIQRAFRARKERKHFVELRRSVVIVQERYKALKLMQFERENYVKLKTSTVKIQRAFRAYQDRRNYLELKRVVINLQRRYKASKLMQIQRDRYSKLRDSTIKIQRRFKAYVVRKSYLELRKATINVQLRYRSLKLMQAERDHYQRIRESSIKIQRAYKAFGERKNYLELRRSVVTIQQRYRALKLMRLERANYLKLKDSSVKIQNKFRAYKERTSYLELKRCVAVIQCRFRAQKVMELERRNYQTLRKSAIKVQSYYRAYSACNSYLRLHRSVVNVQLRYRAVKLMRLERRKYLQLKDSCIKIQSCFRTRVQRKNYLKLRGAAVVVQRRFRASILMKLEKEKYERLRESTVKIQRAFRTYCDRKKYLELRRAAVVIQRRYRAVKLMRLERRKYLQLKDCCIKIQRCFRTRVQRKNYLELREAAVVAQRRFRASILMKLEKEKYEILRESTMKIQRAFRAHCERKKYLELRGAATVVQRRFRALMLMKVVKEIYERLRESTVKIQRGFRAQCERKKYLELRRAAVVIQRRYRALRMMRFESQKYLKCRESIVKIQRAYRTFVECKKYSQLRRAVVVVQCRYRSLMMMREERGKYVTLRESAIKIQRAFRARQERRSIMDPELQKIRKEKNSATKIQAAWRGYKVRKAMSLDLQQIRTRVKAVDAVPEKTLGQRRIRALKILIDSYSSLLQMIRALQDLDYITRRSQESCLQLSKEGPENLFAMVISTARSLPDMQACQLATSILINFCKYEKSRNNCWYPQYLEEFVKVMLHWCDKEGDLFPHFCTLFWLYTHDPEWLECIKKLPNLEQSFAKMKTLSERKAKMVVKSYNSKQASTFSAYTKLPLPSLKPDWGYECKDKPRIFTNSLHALKSILDKLYKH
ncbi:PREDICTED: protein abnormal spindle [Nicrophorus vespilloides]|uniref:Protein abnormal spindle n=1 Tax=Nicrophorus vespilloides TaxID=110193 RepID=A0ABM1MC44_NICVS|nr:PREDICTED: protein abnormal spindle [Nicrophorus vespilloides]